MVISTGRSSRRPPGERRYFLLLIDDATRYMWVVLLTAKSEASSAIKRIQSANKKECDRKLRVLRIDNGGSSQRPSSPPIVLMRGSLNTFQHHTPRSRTGWWSGKSDCGGNGAGTPKIAEDGSGILGGGHGHRGLPTEPAPDEEYRRYHTL
jgi:hypothetical protein